MKKLLQGFGGIEIVRLKNRFKNFLFTGIRDCLLNCSIPIDAKNPKNRHIGEILALKHQSHDYYGYFREYFEGSTASYKLRMETFENLLSDKNTEEVEPSILIERILRHSDEGKISALSDMAEMMGDPRIRLVTTSIDTAKSAKRVFQSG